MTRDDTTLVLNSTDSILSQIDVALANDGWDWSPDIDWWPGDPLYPHPWTLSDNEAGNHVRPMFEIAPFDDTMDSHTRPKCKDCEVSGAPDDKHCWMCGGVVEPTRHAREIHVSFQTLFDQMTESMSIAGRRVADFGRSLDEVDARSRVMWNNLNPPRAVEPYRGLRADYVIYDEFDFATFMNIGYTNIYGVGLRNYRRIVFDDLVEEEPETVEVLVYQSDVDAIQEPPDLLRKDAPLFGVEPCSPPRVSFGQRPYRLSIPCDIPTIVPPTLDMGEPTVVRREVVEGPAYVRFNPSITNQRRRRNI